MPEAVVILRIEPAHHPGAQMRNRLPHPALLQRLLAAAGVGLAVGFAFIAFFTSALHDPKPNAMRVGVVGPPPGAAQVERQLSRAMPGAFDVHRYADAREATDAIREQELAGAFIPGPRHPRLLTAGADGASVTTVLRAAFGAVAAASHHDLTVTDLAPLPAHDARGTSAFFVVAGTTLGSLVFGIVLFFAGGHTLTTPLRLRLTFIAGFSIAAGVIMATATELVADGLGDHFWRVAGIAALLAAVIFLIITALVRWIGTPGVALSALFVMLFSLPATGGAIGPEFVPGVYRDIAPALPSHAALVAVKGSVYFEDGGVTGALAILAAWAVAALLAQIAAHTLRANPPVPPATGSPLDRAGDATSVASTASPPRQRNAATTRGAPDSAIALAAALDDKPDALSATETALLRDWLGRLSTR
jgi:hypothetical protein